jgi:tRNA (guanine37-N1)-methyltransferase
MRFDILTIFPEVIDFISGSSILGRAQNNGLITVNPVNIRDFSKNTHHKVDDYPYGGGQGMVMTPEPIVNAYQHISKGLHYKPFCIYLSPQGKVFNQSFALEFMNKYDHLVFLCGHYEGIDERAIEEIVDIEISIGDFVLTGGEIPAMAMIDSIARLIPGVLGSEISSQEDSFSNGLLEYPQYTRPYEFHGKKVPDVLISGHHANIEKWRHQESLIRTYRKRPDLLERLNLTEDELTILRLQENKK